MPRMLTGSMLPRRGPAVGGDIVAVPSHEVDVAGENTTRRFLHVGAGRAGMAPHVMQLRRPTLFGMHIRQGFLKSACRY
jgi:hypothetical protein